MAAELRWLELRAFCLKMPTVLQLRCRCQNLLYVTFIGKVLLAISVPEIEKILKEENEPQIFIYLLLKCTLDYISSKSLKNECRLQECVYFHASPSSFSFQ